MPRLKKADRAAIRLALRLAIESEDAHADAYTSTHHLGDDGKYHRGPDTYAESEVARVRKNIATFRRLLETHFGGA